MNEEYTVVSGNNTEVAESESALSTSSNDAGIEENAQTDITAEYTQETLTISGNDSISLLSDVSAQETVSEVPVGFYDSVMGGLWSIIYLLSALLFFVIFEWVERKIRSIARKVVGYGKSD